MINVAVTNTFHQRARKYSVTLSRQSPGEEVSAAGILPRIELIDKYFSYLKRNMFS